MLRALLAILTVLAVVALTGIVRLLLLPFRAVRGLFRDSARNRPVIAD